MSQQWYGNVFVTCPKCNATHEIGEYHNCDKTEIKVMDIRVAVALERIAAALETIAQEMTKPGA